MNCIVPGCHNEVVRVLVGKAGGICDGRSFGVCSFHGDAIIRYGTPDQARDYVFPSVAASGGRPEAPASGESA